MSIQIFKQQVPTALLFDLLESLCMKHNKHYIFSTDSFKKGVFKKNIETFMLECAQYYHVSKRKYLEKPLTYNSFTTVLRQICNFNKITYTSQIKYEKSKYTILYYIFFC